jgi:hypothetical protein
MTTPVRPPSRQTDGRPSRPLSVPHLVVGLVFLGIAALWLLRETTDLEGPDFAVLGPTVLIAAGVVGLAAFVVSGVRNRDTTTTAPTDDPTEGDLP